MGASVVLRGLPRRLLGFVRRRGRGVAHGVWGVRATHAGREPRVWPPRNRYTSTLRCVVGSAGVGVGEAAESKVEYVDLACEELEAFCAGSLLEVRRRFEVEGGEVLICGSEDLERWNAVFVDASDRAVVPLAVGDGVEVMTATLQLANSGAVLADRRAFRPPLVVLGGSRCVFEAACGASLLGVVRQGARTVLLVARGRTVAVVYVEGKVRRVLKVGLPGQLGEVDVDRILAATRPRERRHEPVARSLRLEASTRAHHLRIVGPVAVDLGEGPPWAAVIEAIFEGVEAQAAAVMEPKLRRAMGLLPRVLGFLKVLVVEGYGDMRGRVSGIRALIRRRFHDFEVSVRDLASVLRLVEATGLGLVGRPLNGDGKPRRIWEVRLAEIGDPKSKVHRGLCAAIRGRSLGSAEGALAQDGKARKIGGRGAGAEARADAPTEGPRGEVPPTSPAGSARPTTESEAQVVATLASAVCAAIVGVAEGGRAAEGRIAAAESAREAALAELVAAKRQIEALEAERDAAVAMREAVEEKSAVVEAERDAATVERDAATVERDAAAGERDAAVAMREAVEGQSARVEAERDAVLIERDVAAGERDAALVERDAAVVERDAAVAGREKATTLLRVVAGALDEEVRRQQALEGELAALRGELGRAIADLAALRRRVVEAEAGPEVARGRVVEVDGALAEREDEARSEPVAAPEVESSARKEARGQEGTSESGAGEVAVSRGLAVWEGENRLGALPCFLAAALRSIRPTPGRRVSPARTTGPGATRSGERRSGERARGRCALGTLGARGPPRGGAL